MASLRSLLVVAAFGLGLLVPSATALTPYSGSTCNAVASSSCPGKPFATSSFTGVACVSSFSVIGFVSHSEATDVQSCAAVCASNAVMLYRPSPRNCLCASVFSPGAFASCLLPGSYQIYYHSAAAQASGLSRRQHFAAVRRAAEEDTSLCPADLTACRVEGSDDGYECLDTETELESCGGCRYGVFSAPSSSLSGRALRRIGMAPLVLGSADASSAPASRGVDCSDRKRFGRGSTCRAGACVPH